MGESKENDLDMASVTESEATGTKLEAGEALAEPMACEEASLCEGEVVVEEGGSLHGEDIMVEVLGSDVFVDGVCTSSGDGIGENAGDGDAGGGGGAELDSLAVEKVGTQEVEASVVEVAHFGTESEGRDLSGQQVGVSGESGEGVERVVEDSSGGKTEEPLANESKEGVERGVEDSSGGEADELVAMESEEGVERGVEDGVVGETQVVTEEVAEAVREEILTQVLVKEGLQKDESKEDQEGVQGDESKEECVLGDEVQDPNVENGVIGTGGETQVVVDKVSSTAMESVSCTTVSLEQDSQLDEECGVHNDLDKQKAGILNYAETMNPGVDTTVVCSSTVVDSTSVSTLDSQGTSHIVKDKGLNPEVDVASAGPESSGTPAQPTIGEEVGGKDYEKSACSRAEGMETDACDEGSRDEEQAYVEVGCRGIDDHSNVLADPVLSCQSTEVVEGEDLKVLSNSRKEQLSKLDESLSEQLELKDETGSRDNEIEPIVSDGMEMGIASKSIEDITNSKIDDQVSEEKNQHLRSEECVDRSVVSDITQLKSHAGRETELQGEATDAEVKQQLNNGGAENKVEALSDSASLCHPSQVSIKGDVSAMDVNAFPNQQLEIQDSIAVDRMLPCSEDDQNLKAETVRQSEEIDNQASNGVEIATMSSEARNVDVESQGPGGKGHQFKVECSDNSAVHELSGADSRRAELGLACFCIPNDAYDHVKFQVVENTGIQQESSMRDDVDNSASAISFEPSRLVEYTKALAQSPTAGIDQLELMIATTQLHSFYRFKGYSELPEFHFCGAAETLCSEDQVHLPGVAGHSDTVSEDVDQKISETKKSISHKRKHNLRDMYPVKKERSMSELMDEALDGDGPEGKATSKLASPTAAKKRKTFDSLFDDSVIQDGTKSSLAKVSTTTTLKQSFKIGECIQRAATQLTGSPSILKNNNDKLSGDNFGVSIEELEDGQMILPTECTSLDELLSQLHLVAQNPFQGYSFLNMIVSFFSDFRDSVVPSQNLVMEMGSGRRKMPSHSVAGFPETFEFVDMNDSYWTDMVVQNGSLEQLSRKSKKGEYQIVPVALEPDKSIQSGRRPYSRKRSRDANNELSAETQAYMYERRRASPAEIIMTFSTVNSVPSETNLNKMFRRFGPLKELETEVDRETCRARVVFKKGSDAEVACSSAEKFNIFGPLVVNYQLNFYPFEPFKALYIPSTEGLEEATLFLHAQG